MKRRRTPSNSVNQSSPPVGEKENLRQKIGRRIQNLTRKSEDIESGVEETERDIDRGARRTDHRFRI